MRCGCKGNCATICCACFKVKVDCTLRCHGRNSGSQCTNTGDSAAPSGTFRLALNTERIVPPGSSQNPKLRQANRRGDTWEKTSSDSTSAVDSANNGTEGGAQVQAGTEDKYRM